MILPEFDTLAIKQWHIYLVDMNPPRKSKPGKVRPAVVVQNVAGLLTAGVTVLPMTTDLQDLALHIRIHPRPGLQLVRVSDVVVEEIQTVHRAFFFKDLGGLLSAEKTQIITALKFHFDW